MIARPLILIVALAGSARASGAVEEVSAGTSASSSWVANKLAGMWDIDEQWQLRVDLATTRSYAAGTAGDSLVGSISADYAAAEHWTVRVGLGWTPQTTTFAVATVEVDGAMDAAARLRATSAMTSASLSLGYDTGGTSDFETSAGISVGGSYYDARQELLSVQMSDGAVTSDVRGLCAMHACGGALAAAMSPQWTQLGQYVVDANASETLFATTDVGLDAAYYLYDRDPSQGGYFALATFGQGNLGSAIGVAPMQYAVTPSVSHRWSQLSATASVSYGSNVADQGYSVSASLRVQYKLAISDTQRLKLYGKLGSAWSAGADGELSRSGSLGLGAQYSW